MAIRRQRPAERALKFYASIRMDVRRIETLKQGGEMVGNRTRVKVVKNRSHRRLRRQNLTLCSEKESLKKEISWIWQWA